MMSSFEKIEQHYKAYKPKEAEIFVDLLTFIDMSAHQLQDHRQATLAVSEPLPLPPSRLKISGVMGLSNGLGLDQLEQPIPVDNTTLHRSEG